MTTTIAPAAPASPRLTSLITMIPGLMAGERLRRVTELRDKLLWMLNLTGA